MNISPPTPSTSSAIIKCETKGIPSTYTYQDWQLIWPGYGVVKEWPGSVQLNLSDLTYEYSGIYVCSASNNIRNKTGQLNMEGSEYMMVECK